MPCERSWNRSQRPPSKSSNESKSMSDEQKVAEVPAKFKGLVETIEKLSVLDLSELVKVLEGHFGVSAAAPVMVDAAPKVIKEGVPKADAEAWKKKIEEAGGKATLK